MTDVAIFGQQSDRTLWHRFDDATIRDPEPRLYPGLVWCFLAEPIWTGAVDANAVVAVVDINALDLDLAAEFIRKGERFAWTFVDPWSVGRCALPDVAAQVDMAALEEWINHWRQD
jgi:hypothetical protein